MNDKIVKANRRIEECLEKKSISLNLSFLEIENISQIPKILECKHLQTLDLSYNNISDISILEKLSS